ncbi:hypothetical protein NDU88_002021 [Pleurodeles waltl]|uniref:Myb-like domain-containing protein n=1 Tax=Pleurodeles waltl TaxID=8319 RepID=A0AAV7KSE6_PLEWA|nr:hypothetical protein NDU88_002021 [Pleurodeles waltl]
MVSAHQKKGIWRAIAKDVRTLGVYHRRSTHCLKRWEDLRHWSKKTAEAQLGMASQRGRGARRTMTPLMSRILAVAYPELDGRLRASQQPQGASSGGGALAPQQEGTATHLALEGEVTESEATSWTEGEGSSTVGTGADTSDSDSSSDGSSLAVAGTSVPTASTGAVLTVVLDSVCPAPDRARGRAALVTPVVQAPWRPGSSLGVERWRIGVLKYCGRYFVFRLSVGGDRHGVCFYRRGGLSVKVAVCVGGFRHGRDSIYFSAGLLVVLPPL